MYFGMYQLIDTDYCYVNQLPLIIIYLDPTSTPRLLFTALHASQSCWTVGGTYPFQHLPFTLSRHTSLYLNSRFTLRKPSLPSHFHLVTHLRGQERNFTTSSSVSPLRAITAAPHIYIPFLAYHFTFCHIQDIYKLCVPMSFVSMNVNVSFIFLLLGG